MTFDRSSSTVKAGGASAPAEREHLIDLLVAHATEGLSAPELTMMSELCERFPDLDAASFEAAVALLYRTFSHDREIEPLPEYLSRKLHDQAAAWCATPARDVS